MLPRVLIIDDQWGRPDDPMVPDTYGSLPIRWTREPAGDAETGYSVDRAVTAVRTSEPDVVLLDVTFGDIQNRLGVDILQALRTQRPTLPVLILTALDSVEHRELVIRCMALGANEYVEKSPSPERMQRILSIYTDPATDQALYGNSAQMRLLRSRIARVAFSGETSVLIVGASGTGKELVARALHRQGPRKRGVFVAKNCAHAEVSLLDSELFGHEKGAFTGAVSARIGLIEEAHGGVLFLDEIADMPSELQGKLLRALETRTFRRVGGSTEQTSDFQLICATNRSPDVLLRSRRLREDLFFRISTVTLQVPPLRERIEDIPVLAEWFLKRFKARGGASYPGDRLTSSFIAQLAGHSWPGNARELRNVIEREVILSSNQTIGGVDGVSSMVRETPAPAGAPTEDFGQLPADASDWPVARLLTELRLAVEARRRVQAYKGKQWKAEFMRMMYPECRAANAKGFDDLVKRLTQGPWGCTTWQDCPELVVLIESLRS